MIAIDSTTAPALSRPWGFPVYKANIVMNPTKAAAGSDGVLL